MKWSDDLARAVRRVLKKYAAKGKNPKADKHGIETLNGYGEFKGHALFRIVTHDDIEVALDVYLPDLLRDHQTYLENMERDINAQIEDHRRKRQEASTPIILPERNLAVARAVREGMLH